MEKEKISKKSIGILALGIAGGIVAVVIGIFCIMHSAKTKDSYRSIQIYDVEGTATIERENLGTMDAVENLYLESGDRILVGADSFVRLKMDDDKYIMVEENSILSIVAEGTKENSRTSIILEQGAVTNEIRNKLNENSSYDVTTPNSVMAVRGTVFRVEITFDEKGEVYTKVSTFEGKVGTRLILPDGTMKEEVVVVEDGSEVTIHMNEAVTEYLSEPIPIDYQEIPVETLIYLEEIIESGTKLEGITPEELETLLGKSVEEESIEEETKEQTEEETEEETEETKEKEGKPAKKQPKKETKEQTEEETKEEIKEKTTVTVTGETKEEETETPGKSGTYTVTFFYNGVVFGAQTVQEGQCAVVPKLSPAESGAWDFNFSQAITADISVNWK